MAKRKYQTRLPFKPAAVSSSPGAPGSSTGAAHDAKNARPSMSDEESLATSQRSSSASPSGSPKKKSKRDKLNRSAAPSVANPLPKSSGPARRQTAVSFAVGSAGENGSDEETVDPLPTQSSRKTRRTPGESISRFISKSNKAAMAERRRVSSQSASLNARKNVIVLDSDDDDDEVREPKPAMAKPSRRIRKPHGFILSDSDEPSRPAPKPAVSAVDVKPKVEEVSDDSDEIIATPARRRRRVASGEPRRGPDEDEPASVARPSGRLRRPSRRARPSSPPTTQSKPRVHRTAKQKKQELLARRRAGERITQLTDSEISSEDERRGLYDSDSADGFQALTKFEDEDPAEAVNEPPKQRRARAQSDSDSDDDLAGFITEDDEDAPIGAPLDIPLEFTSHAHKPLKDLFPYVIEWLVHRVINPTFNRKDAVYVNAWRKLDDEFSGLATSKFISSVWRPDFSRALKSRPLLESFELSPTERADMTTSGKCEACGRSNHPPTNRIRLAGAPYRKDTLEDIEQDYDDSDDEGSVDEEDMVIPSADKTWNVGSVCCDNAVIAHTLLHWKHALKEWVDDRLMNEGWLKPRKVRERRNCSPEELAAISNSIADDWNKKNITNTLFANFKNQLEMARSQGTTGRSRRPNWR